MQDTGAQTLIEPAALNEAEAARFLSISPRLFRHLITKGEITAISVPGVRRNVFETADLRELLAKWKRLGREKKEQAG